jgi:diguanylate cyclase (GGDEF)-like protein/PAS domain S-box-containing protein
MNPEATTFATAADAEIARLIATLLESGERLQSLTHGEVDTVAGAGGEAYLLLGAQTHLRERELAKSAAILNSLPANIALLDADGEIVSINEAWRGFAHANVMHAPGAGLGLNYLDICDRAKGGDCEQSALAAQAIRAVLSGAQDRAEIEYPCHSPIEQRWFHMTVTPVGDAARRGAVVMHLDISQRRRAEAALAELSLSTESRERILSTTLSSISDFAYIYDRQGRFIFANKPLLDLWGLTLEQAVGRSHLDLGYPKALAERLQGQIDQVYATGEGLIDEMGYTGRDGTPGFYEYIFSPVLAPDGSVESVVGSTRDVTERKRTEVRIQRLNRGYMVLSQINGLIVRASSREELFREACRIVVQAGQFPLAWIGVVDVASQRVIPVASFGADSEFLEQIGERLALDAPLGHGPTAVAVREQRLVVVNDVASDPAIRHANVRVDDGIRSLVSLPLIVAGEVVAVVGLYAGDVDYFDEAELALLRELAEDIAFAIDHIGKSEQLNYVAYYDALTGLANRSLFVDRAKQCLRSADISGHSAAMVLVDLERFKGFNDSLGQAAGDELLRQVGAWLAANLVDPNMLARVGADIFALMLVDSPQRGDAARHLDKLIQSFHEHPFELESGVFRIAGKFGVAIFPEDATDPALLFQKAESALKSAKASGDRHLFYTQKMTETVARRLSVENQLRHALDNEEFVLHYQPKVELRTGKVCGAEALIRWNDPRTGLSPPLQFIPILEETGLIHDVGRWALHQALSEYLRWRDAGLSAPRIAVNVSPIQLRDPAFVADVARLLTVHELAAEGLELEITESMIMADINQSIATLQALRELHVQVAVDDFGTGFSSLGYLSRLPVDSLKIDSSFVNDMTNSPEGLSLVSTIIALAHSLHLKVVAEGVETEEQRGLLKLLRCDEMQGYLYSKPVPAGEFEARFLRAAHEA